MVYFKVSISTYVRLMFFLAYAALRRELGYIYRCPLSFLMFLESFHPL